MSIDKVIVFEKTAEVRLVINNLLNGICKELQ